MFDYKFNEEHLYYMKEQVWECKEDLSVYSRLSEFEHEQIKDHLGTPKIVMDLGCGIGRGAIHLNAMFGDPSIHYILADTTGDTNNTGGFDKGEFYNNLNLTKSFAELNGLNNFEVFDTRVDDWSQLNNVDLIISRCSFGMHVAISSVLQHLLDITTQNCTMIFGTRNRSVYSPRKNNRAYGHIFNEILLLKQQVVEPFPLQDWLILKGKRITA